MTHTAETLNVDPKNNQHLKIGVSEIIRIIKKIRFGDKRDIKTFQGILIKIAANLDHNQVPSTPPGPPPVTEYEWQAVSNPHLARIDSNNGLGTVRRSNEVLTVNRNRIN